MESVQSSLGISQEEQEGCWSDTVRDSVMWHEQGSCEAVGGGTGETASAWGPTQEQEAPWFGAHEIGWMNDIPRPFNL